jgi:hypothetical protein
LSETKTATNIAQILVRITGFILIALGVLFWTNHALNLIPIHILIGFVLVASLWVIAVLAARVGIHLGFVAFAICWGFIVLILGLIQNRLGLVGSVRWVLQIMHLLVGLGAIGQAEWLAAKIKRALTSVLRV